MADTDTVARSSTRTTPYVPDQSSEDAITDALAWEFRARMALGPRLSYDEFARLCAQIAVETLERNRVARTEGHEAELGGRTPYCAECLEWIDWDDVDGWVHL